MRLAACVALASAHAYACTCVAAFGEWGRKWGRCRHIQLGGRPLPLSCLDSLIDRRFHGCVRWWGHLSAAAALLLQSSCRRAKGGATGVHVGGRRRALLHSGWDRRARIKGEGMRLGLGRRVLGHLVAGARKRMGTARA